MLGTYGIEVIAPQYANMNLENPALPAEIYKAFDDKESYIVFDVGGDDDGAIPLGRYHSRFMEEDIDVFFVLNERRVFTSDADGALEILEAIEYVSRLKVTAIINNTHLKEETTPEIVLRGEEFAEEFAKRVNLPLIYTGGTKEILDLVPEEKISERIEIRNLIKLRF